MLDFFDRYKFSVLGVVLFNVSIYVWTNLHIIETATPNANEATEEKIVAVLDFSKDPEPEKQIDPNQDQPENTEPAQNVAANVDKEKTTYTNSFSKSQADHDVWEELKAMEAAEFASLQSDNPSLKSKDDSGGEQSNQNLVKEDADKNDNAGFGMDIVASVTFQLKGRNVLSEKKPSYVCKSKGKVRVKIKVNQKGQVVSKEIDEANTNTQNTCLRNAALEYASQWKFNQDFNDAIRKQGWIEFKYEAQ